MSVSAPPPETDFEQNESRRKRQRTASSKSLQKEPSLLNENGWADQLKTAAYGETSENTTATLPRTHSRRASSLSNENSALSTLEYNHIKPDAGRARVSPTDNMQRSVDELTEGVAVTTSSNPLSINGFGKSTSPINIGNVQPSTPPKKMLRVRSDGKLGSPKVKKPPQDPKPKRTKRSAATRSIPPSLLVIMSYGVDDNSRCAIGAEIEKIYSGKLVRPNIVKANVDVPSEPPKATHPFFLGESGRSSGQKSGSSEYIEDKAKDVNIPPAKWKEVTPKRSRVTSKPADAISSIITDAPLQWKTFGSDHARMSRFPGARDPIWPPQEMLHVGQGTTISSRDRSLSSTLDILKTHRKLKDRESQIPAEEEVLKPYMDSVLSFGEGNLAVQRVTSRDWRDFRRPLRRLMSGIELQRAVRKSLKGLTLDLSSTSNQNRFSDELGKSKASNLTTHKALLHVHEAIATSSTAFDNFECEMQEWTHKYAPKTAEEVLQTGHEAILLRDWLKGLTTNSVETSKDVVRESSVSRKLGPQAKRKKRKRADELNDFLVSSDEDTNEMDEVTDLGENPSASPSTKRSVIRSADISTTSGTCSKSANAVVISGPHGCGKTATVYAVAQELGFEVFEINAGSRRSGRDILDKVGDMTRNHLVGHVHTEDPRVSNDKDDDLEDVSDSLKKEIETGRQGTMNKFFKSKGKVNKVLREVNPKVPKASPKKKEPPRKAKSQKQSLILLEEVDVLFNEDKLFWTTTLSLVIQSKRPVIMTCTDESLLPLEDMILYAILRLTPPPTQLATDYLLLVACNEGHLLSRESVSTLFMAKGSDLRASISELNFFCQIGIGDTKGGLDWMLTRAGTDNRSIDNSRPPRVVSENSYQTAMGWLGGEVCQSAFELSLTRETELVSAISTGWDVDIGASETYVTGNSPPTATVNSGESALKLLEDYDLVVGALSAADNFPACASRNSLKILLEMTTPGLDEKMRSNYVEGSELLVADPFVDFSGITDSLVFALQTSARRFACHSGCVSDINPLSERKVSQMMPKMIEESIWKANAKKSIEVSAFQPITKIPNLPLGLPRGAQISSFDGPTSVVAEDLAPYIRNIVSYDLRLEEQRRQLSSILSGPGKDGKTARTTRSSRAALEGGQKAYTRRERWFPKETNFDSILRTGGKEWQDALQQMMTQTSGPSVNESRRSSVTNAVMSDI